MAKIQEGGVGISNRVLAFRWAIHPALHGQGCGRAWELLFDIRSDLAARPWLRNVIERRAFAQRVLL